MSKSIQKHMWNSWWHAKVEIFTDWMPPHPRPTTKPKLVVVRYGESYLRHSAGHRQGFFWDVGPDDMQSESLAIIAVANAPTPSLKNLMLMEWQVSKEIHRDISRRTT